MTVAVPFASHARSVMDVYLSRDSDCGALRICGHHADLHTHSLVSSIA